MGITCKVSVSISDSPSLDIPPLRLMALWRKCHDEETSGAGVNSASDCPNGAAACLTQWKRRWLILAGTYWDSLNVCVSCVSSHHKGFLNDWSQFWKDKNECSITQTNTHIISWVTSAKEPNGPSPSLHKVNYSAMYFLFTQLSRADCLCVRGTQQHRWTNYEIFSPKKHWRMLM